MFLWKLDHDELVKKRICSVMEENGLSALSLSRALNIDRRSLMGSMGGRNGGIKTAWHLYKFCKHTGISADYLLGLTDEKRYLHGCNKRA